MDIYLVKLEGGYTMEDSISRTVHALRQFSIILIRVCYKALHSMTYCEGQGHEKIQDKLRELHSTNELLIMRSTWATDVEEILGVG